MCANDRKKTLYSSNTDAFIAKARKVHGNKYDYSKVNYVNAHTKVIITCPIHGDFEQLPYDHLRGKNCPICSHGSVRHPIEWFLENAHKVHGDKYDYSKVDYKGLHTKVTIICPKHRRVSTNA